MMSDTQLYSLCSKTIAIVDDNAEFALLLRQFLSSKGYETTVFLSSAEFLNQDATHFDVVLLDLFMPDPNGITVIRQLATSAYAGGVVLMSGEDHAVLRSALELAKAQQLQKITAIKKPFALKELACAIGSLLNENAAPLQAKVLSWMPDTQMLTAAIAAHQFQLYFQPKISLSDNTFAGFEALLRWHHPEHGLIMPDRFIPLAEQSASLMQALTNEVIQLAITQLSDWQQQGKKVNVSINVSMLNLVTLDFPEQLQQLLTQRHLLPEQLNLEVTESALMSEVTSSLDILLRLKMKGFELSIDDFGTGYSSLAQLHRIPFNELKIDRSFVMSMQHSNESKAIVETCIQLGKRLGLTVVAEGVENIQALQLLKDMGCDIGQGYLWSKAVAADEASNWLFFSDKDIARNMHAK